MEATALLNEIINKKASSASNKIEFPSTWTQCQSNNATSYNLVFVDDKSNEYKQVYADFKAKLNFKPLNYFKVILIYYLKEKQN